MATFFSKENFPPLGSTGIAANGGHFRQGPMNVPEPARNVVGGGKKQGERSWAQLVAMGLESGEKEQAGYFRGQASVVKIGKKKVAMRRVPPASVDIAAKGGHFRQAPATTSGHEPARKVADGGEKQVGWQVVRVAGSGEKQTGCFRGQAPVDKTEIQSVTGGNANRLAVAKCISEQLSETSGFAMHRPVPRFTGGGPTKKPRNKLDNLANNNSNCNCDLCEEESAWRNKARRYRWKDATFQRIEKKISFSEIEWEKHIGRDKQGDFKLMPGYGVLVTEKMWAVGIDCPIGVKHNKYQNGTNALRIYAFCLRGTKLPCKLFMLDHLFSDKSCTSKIDKSRSFVIMESTHDKRHCPNIVREPSIKGNARSRLRKVISPTLPKDMKKQQINKLPGDRNEGHNDERLDKGDIMQEIFHLWQIEQKEPEIMKNGAFKFFQHFGVGPLCLYFGSKDQNRILMTERDRYDANEDTEVPRFAGEIDASGGFTFGFGEKQHFSYALVLPVKIPGDDSPSNNFPIIEMVTNDHSTKSLKMFLENWKLEMRQQIGRWPVLQAIITDMCWEQITAIVELNGFGLKGYMEIIYTYITTNNEEVYDKVDNHMVLAFLCIGHLTKHIIKDSKELKKYKQRSAFLAIYVEMVKTENYDQFLMLWESLVVYLLSDSVEGQIQMLLDDFEDRTAPVLMEACKKKQIGIKPNYEKKIPIYLSSGFYKDCNDILLEKTKLLGTNNQQFLSKMCKQLISYCPLWTKILHKPRNSNSNSLEGHFFSINHVEQFWCSQKDGLGKLPLPIDRYIKSRKDSIQALITRYNCVIPKSYTTSRKGTHKRKKGTTQDLLLSKVERTPKTVSENKKSKASKERSSSNHILDKGKIVTSGGSIFPVDQKDYEALMDGCQLHDTTVDALFAIIETDAQWSFAPSHCVQFLFGIGTRSPSLKTACIEVIQLAMKYFADVFTSNSWILFPICYGNHFFLAEIEYENRIFRLYNSLKKCVREDALFFFRRLIERASELKIYTDSPAIHEITAGEWELFNVEAAQQANYVDCGVFVIKYAMDLKNRSNDYNQPFDVVELRKSLQELLLSNVKYKQ